jgi:predicted MFS family arabinose efflux permease
MENIRNRLLFLLGAAHSLNHSIFLVIPLYLTQIANELTTTIETIGFVVAVSGFIYGLGSLFGGTLSDKIGGIKTLMLGMIFAGVSTFVFLIAHDVAAFTVSLVLMGAGASLYHPTANTVIAEAFEGKMAEAMGLHGTGGNFGYMFAPIIIVAIGNVLGWRYPMIFFGIVTIMLSLVIMKMFSWVDKKDKKENESTSGFLDTFMIPGLGILLLYNFFVGMYFKGIDFIFPNFLEQSRGYTSVLQATAVFILLGFGVFGQWFSGKSSNRVGSKRVLVATSVGITSSLVLLLAVPHPLISVALFVLIYGIAFYGHQPALNSLTGLITPNSKRGMVYGIFFFLSFGLGSISAGIAGYFAENYSVETAILVLLLFSVVALFLSCFTPKQPNEAREKT